jgi:integrase/recombinase XerD
LREYSNQQITRIFHFVILPKQNRNMKINRNGQAEALTKENFQQVLKILTNPTHRLIFALCWYTTDRPGSILQLQVNHVYADPSRRIPHDTIVIPRGIRKDRSTRELPISQALKGELKAYQPPLTGYLFPGISPHTHLHLRSYTYALTRAYNKLGWRGFSTYSTRRGSITELAKQGLSIRQLQQVTGHRSLSSLQRYIEINSAEVERAVGLL